MGCASSAQPMITSAGTEMVKAVTHLASDASKQTEDAVQGVRDTMGKTLESAGECVGTVVQNVKEEVKEVVHEKVELLDEAKNALLNKLHLGTDTESENENKNEKDNTEIPSANMEAYISNGIKEQTCNITSNTVTNQEHLDSICIEDKMSASSIEIAQAFANAENSDNHSAIMQTQNAELKNFTNELITEEKNLLNCNDNKKDNGTSCTTETSKVIDMNDMQEKTD